MALSYVKTWTTNAGSTGGDITSSSVSVAVGDVVLVLFAVADNFGAGALSISNTGTAFTWTQRAITDATDNSKVAAWFAVATAAQSMTVSVLGAGSDGSLTSSIAVIVHTGAHATDPVPTGKVYSGVSGTDISQSITPTASGSCLWMIAGDWNQTNSFAAIANCTIENTQNVASQYTSALIRPTTQPRSDGSAFSIGETDTSGKVVWIALEVQAAAVVTQDAYPSSDITNGAWLPSTGSDLYATLDETTASDADYCYTNSNSTMRVALSALDTPESGTRTLAYRLKGSAEKKAIARLIEGSTTVQSWTDDPIPETITGKSQTVTNSISNYANLRFEIEIANATSTPSPSVSFGSIGTGVNGSTSIAVGYPASIAAGDLLVIVATTGATNSETPGTPSGWTSQGSYATTDGTFGLDTGPRRVTVFTREATGGESGTVTVAVTNGNTCRCTMLRFAKTYPSYVWDIAATGGFYGAGTAVSVAGGSISFAPGDVVVVSNGQRVDSVTQSSQSLTASGITFGTRTNRATVAVTTGNDHRHVIDTFGAITAGTATVAPTWSYTASASCSAAVHFLRIREVPPTEKGRLTWVKFSVPLGSGSGISLAAMAANSIAATGAVTMALPVAGASASVVTATGALAMSIPAQAVAVALISSTGHMLLSMTLSAGALAQVAGLAGADMTLPLHGAAQVVAAASGSLPASASDLSGAALAAASGTGAVSISVSISGSALAQALASAGVTVQTALAAAAAAQASGSGGVRQAMPMQGAAVVQATGTGNTAQAIPLAGSGAATATVAGNLQAAGAGALAGPAAVLVGATGNIGMSLPVAGFVQVVSTSTSGLDLSVPVQGTATATVIAGGNLQVTLGIVVSGAALAQAAANGQIVLTVPLSAVALAQASASGALSGGLESFVPKLARTLKFPAGNRVAEFVAGNRGVALAAGNRLWVAASATRSWG